jgi:Transposase domain (DUF772)
LVVPERRVARWPRTSCLAIVIRSCCCGRALGSGCPRITWPGSCSIRWPSSISLLSIRPYRSDRWGAAAHNPQMVVALLLYAYSIGVRSARGIERRCSEDVAFRVITANHLSDDATIARFPGSPRVGDLRAVFGRARVVCACGAGEGRDRRDRRHEDRRCDRSRQSQLRADSEGDPRGGRPDRRRRGRALWRGAR